MANKSVKTVSFKKLFNYAGKEYDILWAECYKVFIKSGLLTYNGTSEAFYLEDLDSDITDREEHGGIEWNSPLRIIRNFLIEETSTCEAKFKHK